MYAWCAYKTTLSSLSVPY